MTRVAVVTGANKGIGFYIAWQLATSNLFSHVIIGCRDATRGMAAQDELQKIVNDRHSSPSHVQYYPLTIGDTDSHTSFCQRMEQEFGKVDVLVNNAGFAYKNEDPTPFEGQTKKTLAITYFGTVAFTESMLPLLRKGNDPRIVNVASMAGRLNQISPERQAQFRDPNLTIPQLNTLMHRFEEDIQLGRPPWSKSNYGMSKLGVIAATKVWARQEAGTVVVNACCPGYCATDMSSHRGTRSPADGARNAVIPATMDDPPTGAFFRDYKVSTW